MRRDLLLVLVGRGLFVVGGLITLRVATSLLSPEKMGTMQQLLSVTVLCSSLFVAPLVSYFLRGSIAWGRTGHHRRVLLVTLTYIVSAAVILGGIAGFADLAFDVVNQANWVWVGAVSLVYIAGYNINHVVSANYNLERRRLVYVCLINLAAWGGLGIAYLLYASYLRPEAWLLGIALGFCLSAVGLLGLAKTRSASSEADTQFDPWHPSLRTAFFFSWPQAVSYLLWWGQSQSYRFILDDIAGLAAVGLYAVAGAVVAQMMQTLKALFDEFYAPKLFGDVSRANTASAKAAVWNRYTGAYGPAMLLFGFAIFGSVAFWPKLLLGGSYHGLGTVFIWPIVKETVESLSSTLWTLGILKTDMRMNLIPTAVGAILVPILVVFLAPLDALHGTGAALAIGAVAVFAVVVPVSRRSLPITWPIRRFLYAALLGIPLLLCGSWSLSIEMSPSTLQALGALALIGAYVVAAQWLLSRSWLATFDREATT